MNVLNPIPVESPRPWGLRARFEQALLPILRQTFILKNLMGLHARPSVLLVRTLRPFSCRATVECEGRSVNARSILGLLSLSAAYDSCLTFTFQGDDACQALMAVKQLFDTQFEAAYQDAVPTPQTKASPSYPKPAEDELCPHPKETNRL